MASPVIDSVTPSGPVQATTGSKVTLTMTDPEGNVSQPFTVPFQWTDGPLVLKAVTDGTSVVTVSGMTVVVQG